MTDHEAQPGRRAGRRAGELSRRSLLGAVAAGGAGLIADRSIRHRLSPSATRATVHLHQAGIELPGSDLRHALVTVYGMPGFDPRSPAASLPDVLRRLGEAALTEMRWSPTEWHRPHRFPLTVTIGVGPRLVSPLGPNLPGAAALPSFVGDDAIAPDRRAGDLIISLQGNDPTALRAARGALEQSAPELVRAWSVPGHRPSGDLRNPFGFHDELANPRGERARSSIWIPDGPAAGGTICVLRLFDLDVTGFSREPLRVQEDIIGRRRTDGAPLTGGRRDDPVDLLARDPDGGFVVPVDAHVRAARRPYARSAPMLRRTFHTAPSNADAGAGMLFLAHQRALATFISIQQRLDRHDRLMRFVETSASGSFLMLPGFDRRRPLGATLFG